MPGMGGRSGAGAGSCSSRRLRPELARFSIAREGEDEEVREREEILSLSEVQSSERLERTVTRSGLGSELSPVSTPKF